MHLSFEEKLLNMTGYAFEATTDNRSVYQKASLTSRDHIIFGQIGKSAPCERKEGDGHVVLDIDKSQVDGEKFDRVYDWKIEDIRKGKKTALVLSEQTGFALESDNGILFLYNDLTNDLVYNAQRSEKLDALRGAAAKENYECRYTMDKNKPGGLAFFRKNTISPF